MGGIDQINDAPAFSLVDQRHIRQRKEIAKYCTITQVLKYMSVDRYTTAIILCDTISQYDRIIVIYL